MVKQFASSIKFTWDRLPVPQTSETTVQNLYFFLLFMIPCRYKRANWSDPHFLLQQHDSRKGLWTVKFEKWGIKEQKLKAKFVIVKGQVCYILRDRIMRFLLAIINKTWICPDGFAFSDLSTITCIRRMHPSHVGQWDRIPV